MATTLERFSSKVNVDAVSGCWLWTGAMTDKGYGKIGGGAPDHKTVRAHRLAYMLFVGPIPEGCDLDHLCRVRHCVNPEHLEAVPHAENVSRSPLALATINASKTHCVHGHEYTPENTLRSGLHKYRQCRACKAKRDA